MDPHRWNPVEINKDDPALANVSEEPARTDRKAGNRNQQRKPAGKGVLALGHQCLKQRAGKREINRPRQHLKSPVRQ